MFEIALGQSGLASRRVVVTGHRVSRKMISYCRVERLAVFKCVPKDPFSGEIITQTRTSRSFNLVVMRPGVVLGENYRSCANELRSIARGLTAYGRLDRCPCARVGETSSCLRPALGCVYVITNYYSLLLTGARGFR